MEGVACTVAVALAEGGVGLVAIPPPQAAMDSKAMKACDPKAESEKKG